MRKLSYGNEEKFTKLHKYLTAMAISDNLLTAEKGFRQDKIIFKIQNHHNS